MSSLALLVLVALAGGLWVFRHWRQGVQLALVMLVFEGAIRKWLLPGQQELIYFAKDGLLLATYAGFLGDRSRGNQRLVTSPALVGLLALSAVYGMLEIVNPNLPSPLVGLFGFKAYFFYAPLLWIVPASFDSREEVWRFIYRYVLLAIPLGILALVQFGSPPTSWINTYARGGSRVGVVSTFGSSSYVRVTGTFSYITGYVSYLFATILLLLGLLSTIKWRFKGFLILYGAFGATVLGMLVTGSRAPILMFAVTLPIFWWLTAARDRQNFEAISRIVVVLGILALGLTYAATNVVEAFYGRASTSHDVKSRILSPLIQPINVAQVVGPLGFGIGATHQAASTLVDDPSYSWTEGLILEDETGRIMAELGPIGFVLIYLGRLYLILISVRYALRFRDRFCQALATTSLLFFLTHLPTGVVFNVTANLFYWFFGGMLFLAAKLERQTALARATVAERVPVTAHAGRPALPVGAHSVAPER